MLKSSEKNEMKRDRVFDPACGSGSTRIVMVDQNMVNAKLNQLLENKSKFIVRSSRFSVVDSPVESNNYNK